MYPNFADWPHLFQSALDQGVRGIPKIASFIARETQSPVRSEADFDAEKLYRSTIRFVKGQVRRMGTSSWRATMDEDYQNGSSAGYQSQAGNSFAGSSNKTKTTAATPTPVKKAAPKKPISTQDLTKASDLADKLGSDPAIGNPDMLQKKLDANVSSSGVGKDKSEMMKGLVTAQLANRGMFEEGAPGLKTWEIAYRTPRPGKGLQWYTVQAETFSDACKLAKKHYGAEPYAGPLLKKSISEASNAYPFMDRMEQHSDLFVAVAEALGFPDSSSDLLYRPLARDGEVHRQKGRTQLSFNENKWMDIAKMAAPAFDLMWDQATFTLTLK